MYWIGFISQDISNLILECYIMSHDEDDHDDEEYAMAIESGNESGSDNEECGYTAIAE